MNIFTELQPEWHAVGPGELLEHPPTVLKAVERPQAAALEAALGITTVREMVTHPLMDWIWRTYDAFRAGLQRDLPEGAETHVSEAWRQRSCGDWLASPLASLQGLSPEAVRALNEALGWVTVRDAATDGAFAAAREIHRMVTGEPVPQADRPDKPLKDYFGDGTRRYLNRMRKQADLPQRPAPPAPPPPPPAPEAQTPAPAAGGGATALRTSPFAEPAAAPGRKQRKEYSSTGTYMPRGGGSRGWFDNLGVARNERANRYRYHEAVDALGFRATGLEHAVEVNMRGAERKEVRLQVRLAARGEEVAQPAACLNISLTGAGLRGGRALQPGEPVTVTFVEREDILGTEVPLLSAAAEVAWCRPVDPRARRLRYDCGVKFGELALETKERLSLILTDRLGALRAAPLPAEADAGP